MHGIPRTIGVHLPTCAVEDGRSSLEVAFRKIAILTQSFRAHPGLELCVELDPISSKTCSTSRRADNCGLNCMGNAGEIWGRPHDVGSRSIFGFAMATSGHERHRRIIISIEDFSQIYELRLNHQDLCSKLSLLLLTAGSWHLTAQDCRGLVSS